MMVAKKFWLSCSLLLLVAFGFRVFIALRLPNDSPDDGRVYAQIALNVLERHVYSHDSEPPYAPSLIRLPGYPLFLASIYAVAGHGNSTAVRMVQAVIDTATCGLIALIAFQWMPDDEWKRISAISALLLAAVNPFTSIYVGTILTEVLTNLLAVLMVLLATLAFKSTRARKRYALWAATGVCAGLAVLFRPDSGLFAAAIGITMFAAAFSSFYKERISQNNDKLKFIGHLRGLISQVGVLSLAFCVVLIPWTIRNYRVFHLVQPLSPAHGEMPGEFVPRGYLMWLRTWLDDGRYIGPVLWRLDTSRITVDRFPDYAFASDSERDRVIALLQKYNYPPDTEATNPAPSANEQAQTTEEGEEEEANEQEADDPSNVEMTPDIDAGFAQLARERIAHAPVRYYVWLPIKRAKSLWFDTHSQYYPFDGELLPLEDLDYRTHQQYWLPLFAILTALYTLLGLMGAIWLLLARRGFAILWVVFAALLIFLRLGFFSTLENPEPRYTVELFPFLVILGGIAITGITSSAYQRLSLRNS
jgi:hypothetical protein